MSRLSFLGLPGVLALALALALVVAAAPSRAVAGPRVTTYTFDAASDARDWSLGAGWAVEKQKDGAVGLVGRGRGFTSLARHSAPITSLKVRFRLDRFHSALQTSLFVTTDSRGAPRRYFVRVDVGGIYFTVQNGISCGPDCRSLGMALHAISPHQLHDLELAAGDGSLDVALDGEWVAGVTLRPSEILPPGGVAFEAVTTQPDYPPAVFVDEVSVSTGKAPHPRAPRPPLLAPPGPDLVGRDGRPLFRNGGAVRTSWTNESVTLSSGRYTIRDGASLVLKDSSLRILKDAVLVIDRGASPLIHSGLTLQGRSLLQIEGGALVPDGGALVAILAFGSSRIVLENARPQIHFINAHDQVELTLRGSRFVTPVGGSLLLNDAVRLRATDSRIGALALDLPAGTSFSASHLPEPGQLISRLSIDPGRGAISGSTASGTAISGSTSRLRFSVELERVMMEHDVLGEGPYERGWIFQVGVKAALNLESTRVRKIWVALDDAVPSFRFSNLRIDRPTRARIGGASLSDVRVTGQWGFTLCGEERGGCATRIATFEGCEGLWLWPHKGVEVVLRRSSMNELDARNFRGVLTFDKGRWGVGGEIILDRQSRPNDFVIRGSLTMESDAKVPGAVSWEGSFVTREYIVRVLDAAGAPAAGTTVRLQAPGDPGVYAAATTDHDGNALLKARFDDRLYPQSGWRLRASNGAQADIDYLFFADTPIVLQVGVKPPSPARRGGAPPSSPGGR
jgi:hypothetical protein